MTAQKNPQQRHARHVQAAQGHSDAPGGAATEAEPPGASSATASSASASSAGGASSAPWWGSIPERGSLAALRLLETMHRRLGRRFCLVVLQVAALYFVIAAGGARRASRTYLATLWATPEGRRALGPPPTLRSVLRHVHEFSINIFDRIVVWSGNLGQIEFRHSGSEVMFELAASGRGAFLVGAHQGSYDLMRLLAQKYRMTVNVLMFTQHAPRINAFFEQLDPDSRIHVLEIEPNSLKTTFLVRDCIARGEFVGILADRIVPGTREKPVSVEFLGRQTPFSLAPFTLATVIGCPVVHTQCIRLDDRTYESSAKVLGLDLEPSLPRRRRADALLREYVREIEKTCLRTPYQWFNFFDYWGDRERGDA
ncbi:MAG TPA: hypothetical protein VGK20_02940 [Candidatus Binatia bacterium]